ncbi:tetratricopeptide repeat protein 23 isoform X5 [Canis lupus dingo]|uniref:tetratricopeptide repeat protein 23 isoform X5 n=1 Tax=Canis lupus dingo TaxID=286419 RepID=UPI0020C43089|nr:tetratricopeptide repeat protein 23 isoform X5 [Canis lupus dingo]
MTQTERERQRHRRREKQAPCREPDVGLDSGTPGSCPGPKAGAKPLSHPGIPQKDNVYKNMQESKETHISNHLDEIVAAVSVTPRKKIQNKLPQTALFQPPREKLHLCEEKAKSYSSSHKHKEAVHELVRCIALTRICYGDSHWKLAEAHINLAQGYLQLKGLSLQAKQHAEKAKEILTNSLMPPYNDNTDVFKCSIELFHTMGRALLSLQKFKEASENLSKAERLAKELLQCGRIIKEEWIEIQARIKLSSAQMYQSQKKSKEALPHYQEALEYIEISRGEKSLECVSILRELAGVEQSLGFYDASINHFLQAHLIVLSKNPSQEEAAVSAHFVAHASIASGRPEHHDVAEQYFQESMANLKDAEGMGKAKFLSIQDDYCHFLQVIGQKELSWRKMMVACSKTVARGWSKVVGESRDVDKDVEATAHGSSECLQIQTLLYGPQDKRTLATQQTMDVLAKAPEVAVKPRQTPRAKAAFCGCAAQHGRWDSMPSRLFAPTGNRAAPPTPGGPHWDLGDPSGDLVLL